jgi:peptidoglycan/LPS O-acetylase OafA/YrhL
MNLDEVLDAWRSQDQAPLYGVDEGRLQQALREEEAKRRRGLVIEARITYGFAALVFAGLALVFVLMIYDDDPRTWWDFVIVTLGVAAAVFAAANLYIGRTRLALRERQFGASLHHELGRHVALLDYELSRTWRVSAITRTMLPFYLCTLALYLSIWRINNEPFKWGTDGFPLLAMSGAMWYGAWIARHAAQDVLPRKRRLEELLEKLDAR